MAAKRGGANKNLLSRQKFDKYRKSYQKMIYNEVIQNNSSSIKTYLLACSVEVIYWYTKFITNSNYSRNAWYKKVTDNCKRQRQKLLTNHLEIVRNFRNFLSKVLGSDGDCYQWQCPRSQILLSVSKPVWRRSLNR